MGTENQVQILDETLGIPLSANIGLFFLKQWLDNMADRAIQYLCIVTILGEGKLWIQSC